MRVETNPPFEEALSQLVRLEGPEFEKLVRQYIVFVEFELETMVSEDIIRIGFITFGRADYQLMAIYRDEVMTFFAIRKE